MRHVRKGASYLLPFVFLLSSLYFLFPKSTEPSHRSSIDSLAPVEILADDFRDIRGIAIDENDLVYVADREADTVIRIEPDGSRTIVARLLDRPTGLAFDPSGRLLIVERGGGRLLRLETDGSLTILLSGIDEPRWIAVAEDGNIYLTARAPSSDGGWGGDGWSGGGWGGDGWGGDEDENEVVLQLSPAGGLAVFAGVFERLRGILAHRESLFAAAESSSADNNGGIFQIPILPDGTAGDITRFTQDDLDDPVGLARDRLGALYLSAEEIEIDGRDREEAIGKVAPDGTLSHFASDLDDPQGLAFDQQGNLYLADGRRLLRFLAPSSPAVDVPAFTNQNSITVTGTTDLSSRIDAFLNDSDTPITILTSDGNFSLDLNLTTNNQNLITVFTTAQNGVGLTSAPAEFSIFHDSISPVIANLVPVSGAFLNNPSTQISAGFSDGGSGADPASVHILLDDADITAQSNVTASGFTFTPSIPLSEGPHFVSIAVADRAGNSASIFSSFTIDVTPPDTQITGGPDGKIDVTSATFTFTGTDNLTSTGNLLFAWRLDSGPFTPFSLDTTAAFTDLTEGPHTFEVKALDLAGNQDPTPASRSFTVSFRPVITSVEPSSGTVGTLATVNGSGFRAGENQVSFNGVPAVVRTATTNALTVTVPPGATSGPVTVTTTKGTGISPQVFTVLTNQDFALSVVPSAGSVVQGSSRSYTVQLTSTGGQQSFTGLANLAVTGPLPAGVTASVTPSTLTSGQGATITVTAGPTASLGSNTLTVNATALIDGTLLARTSEFNLDVLQGGITSLTGRVLDTDNNPVQGVTLTLAGQETETDASGSFLFQDVPAGPDQFLFIDGSTAVPDRKFPTFPALVTLEAGQTNTLPFTPFLHPQKDFNFTEIISGQETVVTDPDIPGFEMRIPDDVEIIGWDGQPNTKVSVRTVPLDRIPLPHPNPPIAARSVYMFYFDKVGGGTPSRPVPVTAANDLDLQAGEKAELWYYDEGPTPGSATNRWQKAGTATVSADGKTISTDPGVGLPRFCCGAFCFARFTNPSLASQSPVPDGKKGGEPVDLATGLFILEKTDMVLPGRFPIALTRTYRTNDNSNGPFGIGTSTFFSEVLLTLTAESLIYVQPGNTRIPFALQPDGTFINETIPSFRGAKILVNPDGTRTLRFRDGANRIFEPSIVGRFQLRAITDRNGNTLTISRDIQGRPIRLTEPGGRSLRITYTASSNSVRVESVRDPLGRVVSYSYDLTGRLETATDPAGGVTRYTYDSNGNLLTITDPRGVTFLTNEYSASGRVIRQVEANGGEWSFAYMLSGAQITGPGCPGPTCPEIESLDTIQQGFSFTGGFVVATTLTDPRGNSTTYRFNNFGYVIEEIDALGQATQFERAEGTSLLLSTTDPLGPKTSFTYDANGNVTKITDPEGNIRSFEYDPIFNKVTKITDPLGNVTRFEYDAQGNLTATTDPLGNHTVIAYNTFGQPISTTDPLGNTTQFEYDAVGNLITITDPLGNRSRREYDTVGRLIKQIDPRGKATNFVYDALNRINRITDPAGGVTQFSYDGNGNLLIVTDARGNTIAHTYDNMDQLATRTDPVGAVESFQYDEMGNLTQHTDRKGQINTFQHDPLNRRSGATYADGATTDFLYDAVGRLIQATDSVGGTIVNGYDTLNRLVAQITRLGTVGYEYDAVGRRTQMEVPGQAPVEYSYDAASRLTQVLQGTQVVDLQYDSIGRRTQLVLPNGVSTEYQYDAASRLTELIYRNTTGILDNITYAYDATGNRTQVGGSFARTLLPDPVTSATYDAANRQLQFGDKTMTFDANGNLESITDASGTTNFTWDARNRLVALSDSAITGNFTYDALGRRIVRDIKGETFQYLYDGLDVVQELQNLGTRAYLRSLRVDEVFSVTNGDSINFLIHDALNSTVAVTDAASSPLAEYTYSPFGQTSSTSPSFPNLSQFTGREHEEVLGLYYYRDRYYDPRLQRFISEDPWGVAAGDVNLYVYVTNNPQTFVDPLGWWTPRVHAQMTREAMQAVGGFHPWEIEIAVRANIGQDSLRSLWDRSLFPQHYMPGTQEAAEGYIREELQQAEFWRDVGGSEFNRAVEALGRALHGIQDKWAHSQGEVLGTYPQHICGYLRLCRNPDNPEDNRQGARRAREETEQVIRDFQRGRGSKRP